MSEVGSVRYIARIDTSKLGADAKDAESKVSSLGDSNERAAERSGRSWSTFAKVGLAAVATAAIAVAAVITKNLGGAIDRVDTLNNAPKVLANLGYDADASDKSIKRIASSLKGLPSRLNDVVSNQVAVASSTDFSIEKVTDLTLAFNNMGLAGGKGAAEANRAFVQFTQGLGRGKFQAQDFNTLMEVMPAQLSQVAKSLLGPTANAVTLKNALSDGTVTNDMFVDSIIKLDKEGGKGFSSFAKQAKDATSGIQTGMDNFGAAVQRGIATVIQTIGSQNISNAISVIGQGFESALTSFARFIRFVSASGTTISSWLTQHSTLVTNLAIVFTSLLLPAIISFGISSAVSFATFTAGATAAGIQSLIAGGRMAAAWLLALGPIGLIIAAVTGAAALIISNFSSISNFVSSVWRGITSGASSAFNSISSTFSGIVGALTSPFKQAAGTINGIMGGINSAVNGAIDLVNKLIGKNNEANSNKPGGGGGGGGWTSGGFTGRGGVNDVAGLVHKGEYVLPQSAVDQSTGMPKLEGIMMKNGGSSNSEITISTINIADQSTADYFIRKLSGNQEITTAGLVPNQKYMGA